MKTRHKRVNRATRTKFKSDADVQHIAFGVNLRVNAKHECYGGRVGMVLELIDADKINPRGAYVRLMSLKRGVIFTVALADCSLYQAGSDMLEWHGERSRWEPMASPYAAPDANAMTRTERVINRK